MMDLYPGMLRPGGQSLFYNAASQESQMIGNKLSPEEGVSFSVVEHMVFPESFLSPQPALGICFGPTR